jgi:hypothetical protein
MKTLLIYGAGLALAVVGTALADDWVSTSVHELGDINGLDSLANGGAPYTITITEPTSRQYVTGWAIEFDYDEVPDSISWASDVLLTITSPTGSGVIIGGLSSGNDHDWDFQGNVSDAAGHYADTVAASENNFLWTSDPQPGGDWTLTFLNDWNSSSASTLNLGNVVLTFYLIPTPGSLALLGVAGLIARPRRRR